MRKNTDHVDQMGRPIYIGDTVLVGARNYGKGYQARIGIVTKSSKKMIQVTPADSYCNPAAADWHDSYWPENCLLLESIMETERNIQQARVVANLRLDNV